MGNPCYYIAGRMRGIVGFNHSAFYAAEARLKAAGFDCINPARLDNEAGFDEKKDCPDDAFLCQAFARDLPAICHAEGLALIPGWRQSEGVTQIELPLARMLNKHLIDAETLESIPPETVLTEAVRLTSGDRDGDYGHPAHHWALTTNLINEYFGTRFVAEDWGKIMVFDKLARDQNKPKRDNLADVCGYARCIERVRAVHGLMGFVP